MKSKEREALKLALKALKKNDDFLYNWHENDSDDEADAYATARQLNEQAITAAEKALARPKTVNQFHPDYADEAINEMTLTIQKQAQRIEELEAQVAQSAVGIKE